MSMLDEESSGNLHWHWNATRKTAISVIPDGSIIWLERIKYLDRWRVICHKYLHIEKDLFVHAESAQEAMLKAEEWFKND